MGSCTRASNLCTRSIIIIRLLGYIQAILIIIDMIFLVICPKIYTYQHESLVSVFEEGEILELDQPDGNIALVDEETCEKHEWNDQDGGKGHCQLLI